MKYEDIQEEKWYFVGYKGKLVKAKCVGKNTKGKPSHIRTIKLGNLEHEILPTANSIGTLKQALERYKGTGAVDLIWGPDIDIEEHISDYIHPEIAFKTYYKGGFYIESCDVISPCQVGIFRRVLAAIFN